MLSTSKMKIIFADFRQHFYPTLLPQPMTPTRNWCVLGVVAGIDGDQWRNGV